MAGTVRRMTMPASTPRTKAKAAYATGTMPRAPKSNGASRLVEAVSRWPPRQGRRQAEQSGEGHGGQAEQAELGGQPAGPGGRLGPDQPLGAGLQLAGDQRGAPEDADQRRDQIGQGRAEDVRQGDPAPGGLLGEAVATGSSRMSSSGRLAMARVRASWARWPPESRPAFCAGSSPSAAIRPAATAASQRGLR